MKALRSARLPPRVSWPLPVPLTVTPAPPRANKAPLGTLKVTLMVPLPASTSLKLMPLSARLVSSLEE